jgi:hypothetical protein
MQATVEKYAKGLTSLLVLAFAVVALFWGGDIFGFHITGDFEAKVIALIPLASGVIVVIGTKNATPDAIDKAIMQFFSGAISIALFFHEIPSDLGVKIGAVVYAAVAAVYVVWRIPNSETTVSPAVPGG